MHGLANFKFILRIFSLKSLNLKFG